MDSGVRRNEGKAPERGETGDGFRPRIGVRGML